MERSERKRLETFRNHLKRDLAAVEELLTKAHEPRRLSRKDTRLRALAICKDVTSHGKPIWEKQLRGIVERHGMPYAAVGSLFGARYLKRSKKGIELGKLGRGTIVKKAPQVLARFPNRRRKTQPKKKRPRKR